MKVVILAGGEGKRLEPYTVVLPKPLLPVGHYPILEIIIRQLKGYGLKDITLAVGYLGNLIQAFCKNGEKWARKRLCMEVEMPACMITLSDLARRAKCSASTASRAAKGELAHAVQFGLINADDAVVLAWVARQRARKGRR